MLGTKDTTKYNTDAPHYVKEDSGCPLVTDYLNGRQSKCLECPLPHCILDKGGERRFLKEKRDEEIRKLWIENRSEEDLASMFGICEHTVQRIIGNWR